MGHETAELRRAIELLATRLPLSTPAIDTLVRATTLPRTRERGARLLTHHDARRCVHLVTAGLVRLEYRSGRTRPLIADFFTPGELLWTTPGMTAAGWTACYRAHDSEVRVACIDRPLFDGVLAHESPARAAAFVATSLRLAAERIAEKTLLLATRLEERFPAAFAIVARRFGAPHPRGVVLQVALTHREWSGVVGCTRENATRHLTRLRAAGRILIEGRHIVLLP